jgi:hypothetical protein
MIYVDTAMVRLKCLVRQMSVCVFEYFNHHHYYNFQFASIRHYYCGSTWSRSWQPFGNAKLCESSPQECYQSAVLVGLNQELSKPFFYNSFGRCGSSCWNRMPNLGLAAIYAEKFERFAHLTLHPQVLWHPCLQHLFGMAHPRPRPVSN